MSRKPEYDIDPIDGLRRLKVQEWAARKHKLLTDYITASSPARGGWPKRTYIDLYCGPGKCIHLDGSVTDGSPVAAVRASVKASFTEVYISDLDAENVSACAERLSNLGIAPTQALSQPAEQSVISIKNSLDKNALHLAFLDPFSLHALPFSVVARLAEMRKIDLLIHFSAMDFARNYQRLIKEGTIDAFIPGACTDHDPRRNPRDNRRRAFGLWYRALLDRKFFAGKVETVKGNGRQMYWLIHATRNETALKIWNDIQGRDKQRGFGF